MITFLLKGLLRDKSRSRMPIMVVAIGVMLSVFMHAYVNGLMTDTLEMNARFSNGHVKVVTRAYAENVTQLPIDLSLLETGALVQQLRQEFPKVNWVERIHFGGLIDVPNEQGETRSQGPVVGIALDLLSGKSGEVERLNISKSLVRGRLPEMPNEVMISELFSQKLEVHPGDSVTLIGSTIYGGMTTYNFVVSGTLSFGVKVLDKGTVIADIGDVRIALDMVDAASEIAGFFQSGFYSDTEAFEVKGHYQQRFVYPETDEFAPVLIMLRDQGNMGQFLDLANSLGTIITLVFVLAMSIVLWNAGLLGGLRRYGEFGIRLAMGEGKSHVYLTLLYESIMIGIIGTIVGTAFGLGFAWLMQEYGINLGDMMKGSSMMMPNIIRTHITPVDFYVGFIPGILSTVVGAALSGIGIYKRKTSQLFKELEA